jgi:4,5-DOPA dioxygenase extradiol
VAERAGDLDALSRWRSAPHAARAHPTPEHLLPLLFVEGTRVEPVFEGFQYGTLSMRTFAAHD